jgi:hypothetical protein
MALRRVMDECGEAGVAADKKATLELYIAGAEDPNDCFAASCRRLT